MISNIRSIFHSLVVIYSCVDEKIYKKWIRMEKITITHSLTKSLLSFCCYKTSSMRKKLRFRIEEIEWKITNFLSHEWRCIKIERQKWLLFFPTEFIFSIYFLYFSFYRNILLNFSLWIRSVFCKNQLWMIFQASSSVKKKHGLITWKIEKKYWK